MFTSFRSDRIEIKVNDRLKLQEPPNLTSGDSSVVALKGSWAVLRNKHFNPFPQPLPMRLLGYLINQFPKPVRIRAADIISSTIGHPADNFPDIDLEDAARWVTSGFSSRQYNGCIIGAPGLAAAFLSGLTGFPFLPQPLLFNARKNVDPDNAFEYLTYGSELANKVLMKNPCAEAIIHFDPVHDRFLISKIIFIRFKYIDIPKAYAEFIQEKLTRGATIILLDCAYPWMAADISERLSFQLGGLGDIAPEDYIQEAEYLRKYRQEWRSSNKASWNVPCKFHKAPESEWGSTGIFLDRAEQFALKAGHRVIRFFHNHPQELSDAVFYLYKQCRLQKNSPGKVYIAAFTNIDPLFPLVTDSLPIWLPFITNDSFIFLKKLLEKHLPYVSSTERLETAYLSLHPSFCSPPDLVRLESWLDLLRNYFSEIKLLGVNPTKYPEDFEPYISMHTDAIRIANQYEVKGQLFRKPDFDELERILSR